jgi:hypothetical protein
MEGLTEIQRENLLKYNAVSYKPISNLLDKICVFPPARYPTSELVKRSFEEGILKALKAVYSQTDGMDITSYSFIMTRFNNMHTWELRRSDNGQIIHGKDAIAISKLGKEVTVRYYKKR